MKNLQLSLKNKWFEMTKAGIKTEDYRELTNYWFKRLFNHEMVISSRNLTESEVYSAISQNKDLITTYVKCNDFSYNIMTLGYPKKTDTDRIIKLEHKGIEIRQGNPEWGAEPGKIYFVIKHGKIVGH